MTIGMRILDLRTCMEIPHIKDYNIKTFIEQSGFVNVCKIEGEK